MRTNPKSKSHGIQRRLKFRSTGSKPFDKVEQVVAADRQKLHSFNLNHDFLTRRQDLDVRLHKVPI
jgi:hypothetical protein